MGIKQYLAKDFMSKDIISVSADINIHDLVKIFVEHPVSALPVVGEKIHYSELYRKEIYFIKR